MKTKNWKTPASFRLRLTDRQAQALYDDMECASRYRELLRAQRQGKRIRLPDDERLRELHKRVLRREHEDRTQILGERLGDILHGTQPSDALTEEEIEDDPLTDADRAFLRRFERECAGEDCEDDEDEEGEEWKRGQ